MKLLLNYDKDLKITFDLTTLNIHIENSFKKSKKEIRSIICDISNLAPFHALQVAGFDRSNRSMIREWCAHNFLYKHNYKRERTKDVDLNQNESLSRRLGYFFLSLFYK